jgi:hypothetical protein
MTRGNYVVRRGSLVSHNHEQVTRAVDDQTTWRNCSRGSTAFMARGKELLAAGRGGRATEAGRQAGDDGARCWASCWCRPGRDESIEGLGEGEGWSELTARGVHGWEERDGGKVS